MTPTEAQPPPGSAEGPEDLPARVELSPAARTALVRLQETLTGLADGQVRLAQELGRARRRLGLALAALALVTLVGGGALLGVLLARPVPPTGSLMLPPAGAPIVLLDPSRLPSEDEAAPADAARLERMEAQLATARDERNRQLGESARLQEQLVAKERRIQELVASLDDLAARVGRPATSAALVSRTADRPPSPLRDAANAALAACGVESHSLAEVGGLEQGALVDLLVARHDGWGRVTGVEPMARASLAENAGVVSLLLWPRPDEEGQGEGAPPGPEAVPLPRWDERAWSEVGLALPRDFVPADEVAGALADLLPGGWVLQGVGGFAGGQLLQVSLEERDADGRLRALVFAPRGWIDPAGPALVLEDGMREEGGHSRPFWRGRLTVPLPGADLARWRAVVGG